MSDLSKMDEARAVIEEADQKCREALKEQEGKPKLLTSTRFMEVQNISGRAELINIQTISEIFPITRVLPATDEKLYLTRIIFANGEDIIVKHTYSEIKSEIRQYFK